VQHCKKHSLNAAMSGELRVREIYTLCGNAI
jgi:hypothetical protein